MVYGRPFWNHHTDCTISNNCLYRKTHFQLHCYEYIHKNDHNRSIIIMKIIIVLVLLVHARGQNMMRCARILVITITSFVEMNLCINQVISIKIKYIKIKKIGYVFKDDNFTCLLFACLVIIKCFCKSIDTVASHSMFFDTIAMMHILRASV